MKIVSWSKRNFRVKTKRELSSTIERSASNEFNWIRLIVFNIFLFHRWSENRIEIGKTWRIKLEACCVCWRLVPLHTSRAAMSPWRFHQRESMIWIFWITRGRRHRAECQKVRISSQTPKKKTMVYDFTRRLSSSNSQSRSLSFACAAQ